MSNIASKKRVSLVQSYETRLNSEIVLVVCPREELLTPERWQDIEALYHAARERGPGALAEADPELKREVEALLAQDTEGLLDRPAADLLDDAGIAMLGAAPSGPNNIEATLASGAFQPGAPLWNARNADDATKALSPSVLVTALV